MGSPRTLGLVLVGAGLLACNVITGVDDFQFGTGGAATSTTTATGGAGGGERMCDSTQKECSEQCVPADETHGCPGSNVCDPCPTAAQCCVGIVGCIDLSSDKLHCGTCDRACASDELCVDGGCFQYVAADTCTACPCAPCVGDFDNCCTFPGTTTPVCVSHDAPPACL